MQQIAVHNKTKPANLAGFSGSLKANIVIF
jgi:hypothetical protein